MKLSIITICFNSFSTIEATIKSVLSQNYENLEYIIIDGNSTDNTLEIIHKYRNRISKIISEKDNGIYDAMNKGVCLASGDVIGILNSDDFYEDNNEYAFPKFFTVHARRLIWPRCCSRGND